MPDYEDDSPRGSAQELEYRLKEFAQHLQRTNRYSEPSAAEIIVSRLDGTRQFLNQDS